MYKKIFNQFTAYFKNRTEYFLDHREFVRDNRIILWSGTILYILILLLRSWPNFSHPGFYVEDANYYFKLNYNAEFSFADIFRNPNGYYNIFNNFIAQLIGDIDVRLQPLFYEIVALSISVVTIIGFSRSGLIKNKYLLLVTPLVLGLSGLNHIFYYITITFQMYTLVITLFLVLLWESKKSRAKNICIALFIPFLVWSGPYSVMAVPFAVIFILMFRGKTSLMLWTIAVVIFYALSTTSSTVMLRNIFVESFRTLWFETLISDIFLMGMKQHVNIEKILILLAIFGPAFYFIRRDTFSLKVLLILFAVIVSSMAPLFLSKKYIMYRTIYPCHLLIGQFFWILFVLILLDRVLDKIHFKYSEIAGVVAMCSIAAFVFLDNYKNKGKREFQILNNTPVFLEQVHQAEQLSLKEKNQYMIISADAYRFFSPQAIVGSRDPDAQLMKHIHVDSQGNVNVK